MPTPISAALYYMSTRRTCPAYLKRKEHKAREQARGEVALGDECGAVPQDNKHRQLGQRSSRAGKATLHQRQLLANLQREGVGQAARVGMGTPSVQSQLTGHGKGDTGGHTR